MLFSLRITSSRANGERRRKLETLGFKYEENGYKDWADPNPTIEINTLGDLLAFIKEWGDIVMSETEIEIYDDYRE